MGISQVIHCLLPCAACRSCNALLFQLYIAPGILHGEG